MYVQKEFTKHVFVDGKYKLYSQFYLFCIISYFLFELWHIFSNASKNGYFTPFLEVKAKSVQQKIYLHISHSL